MKVTRRSRLMVRLQNWLFVALFLAVIGMLAFMSTRYSFEADWTHGQRNTLTEASRHLLQALDEPVSVTAFVRDADLPRRQIEDMIGRYTRHTDLVRLEFVNPDLEPERTRRAGIAADGEVLVEYRGRSERLSELNERSLTSALQRLTRGGERWLVFIEGHGERNPHGEANHDYGLVGGELERQGFRLQAINPAAHGGIPDNTTVLVIAGPQVNLVPGAVDMLVDHIEHGGNLLWLGDPGPLHGLEPLAEHLGIAFPEGVVVDTTAQMFGIADPTMVIVAEYPRHEVTRDLQVVTLFPHAAAVDHEHVPDEWRVEALLTTLPRSWLETGELAGGIRFDAGAGDRPGPLDIGVTLSRPRPGDEGMQRIAVIGDGDFMANAFLNNAGNLDFALNLFNWLSHDDQLIAIHMRSAPDLALNLPRNTFIAISFGFLIVLPLLLVGAGVAVWIRRRRR